MSNLGANRKKLATSEPKLVASLVMLMDSQSLKVQCQAALALRNLASDGRHFSRMTYETIGLSNLGELREVPARNRQSRWPATSPPPAPVYIPSTHPVICRLCPQRVHPSHERVSYHRIRLPSTSHQPPLLQGQRGGTMPRHLDTPQSCS